MGTAADIKRQFPLFAREPPKRMGPGPGHFKFGGHPIGSGAEMIEGREQEPIDIDDDEDEDDDFLPGSGPAGPVLGNIGDKMGGPEPKPRPNSGGMKKREKKGKKERKGKKEEGDDFSSGSAPEEPVGTDPADIFEEMPAKTVAAVAENMKPDDVAGIVEGVDTEVAADMFEAMVSRGEGSGSGSGFLADMMSAMHDQKVGSVSGPSSVSPAPGSSHVSPAPGPIADFKEEIMSGSGSGPLELDDAADFEDDMISGSGSGSGADPISDKQAKKDKKKADRKAKKEEEKEAAKEEKQAAKDEKKAKKEEEKQAAKEGKKAKKEEEKQAAKEEKQAAKEAKKEKKN